MLNNLKGYLKYIYIYKLKYFVFGVFGTFVKSNMRNMCIKCKHNTLFYYVNL